jgi:GNAT superfamily N-acetyltransferase
VLNRVVRIRTVPYDHADATMLIGEVQQEYVRRYGGEDTTPVDPAQFAPPLGLFLMGYLDGVPVATGGWRVASPSEAGLLPGDAELKRMYVVPSARGRGFARALLAELERTALAAGRRRMVLETGNAQPEAVALYISSGYDKVPKFGVYKHSSSSIYLGKALESGTEARSTGADLRAG